MTRRKATESTTARPVMSGTEYQSLQVKAMSEKDLDTNIMSLAHSLGYTLDYHTYDSRKSDYGLPDRILVSVSQKRVLWIEEKREGAELTPPQAAWIAALQECGQEAYIIRPSDWYNGAVEKLLKTKPARGGKP